MPPTPVYIYHITSISNLPSILASGRLNSKSLIDLHSVRYTNIAYDHIQDR